MTANSKLLSGLVKLLKRPETRALLLLSLSVAEAKYLDKEREDELKRALEKFLGPLGAEALSSQTFYRVLRLALVIADVHLAKSGLRSGLERAGLADPSPTETPTKEASSDGVKVKSADGKSWFVQTDKPSTFTIQHTAAQPLDTHGWLQRVHGDPDIAGLLLTYRAKEDLPGWELNLLKDTENWMGSIRYVVTASKHFQVGDPATITGSGESPEKAYEDLLKTYAQLKSFGLR